MWNKFLRVATVGVLTLSTVAPAFALCAPNTPHCVNYGNDIRLNKAKQQVFDPNPNCDTSPAQICDTLGRKTPTSKNVVVAPAARR